jgi:hypothetical protein
MQGMFRHAAATWLFVHWACCCSQCNFIYSVLQFIVGSPSNGVSLVCRLPPQVAYWLQHEYRQLAATAATASPTEAAALAAAGAAAATLSVAAESVAGSSQSTVPVTAIGAAADTAFQCVTWFLPLLAVWFGWGMMPHQYSVQSVSHTLTNILSMGITRW